MVKLHTTAELARFLWIEVELPQLWLLFLSFISLDCSGTGL